MTNQVRAYALQNLLSVHISKVHRNCMYQNFDKNSNYNISKCISSKNNYTENYLLKYHFTLI